VAKELPFFKFEPSGWENGKIQLCTFEVQGVFINVCSMYWQRLGDLPYKLALQKICKGNATALQTLCDERIIEVVEGLICIHFLNEQLSEFTNISNINSKNAREGWEKRRNEATAMRPHSEGNAIREEKKREEEKREEKKPARAYEVPFVDGCLVAWLEWEQYLKEKKKKLTPSTAKKQFKFLGGRADPEIIAIINQSIEKGWQGLFEINKTNNGTTNGKFTQTTLRRADATIEEGKDFGQL
jgi:hypothetical protein